MTQFWPRGMSNVSTLSKWSIFTRELVSPTLLTLKLIIDMNEYHRPHSFWDMLISISTEISPSVPPYPLYGVAMSGQIFNSDKDYRCFVKNNDFWQQLFCKTWFLHLSVFWESIIILKTTPWFKLCHKLNQPKRCLFVCLFFLYGGCTILGGWGGLSWSNKQDGA